MRAKITDIGENDAFYRDREALIGRTGEWRPADNAGKYTPYNSGAFILDSSVILTREAEMGERTSIYFLDVTVEEIE